MNKLEQQILANAKIRINEAMPLMDSIYKDVKTTLIDLPYCGLNGVIEKLTYNILEKRFIKISYPVYVGDDIIYRDIIL